MAINRAPFNALVDDDGSNTVGTVWNKTAILNVLLDPMDAAYAAPWTDIAYQPTTFVASGAGTWTVAGFGLFAYQLDGKTLRLAFQTTTSTIGGTPTGLDILLTGNTINRGFPGVFNYSYAGGAGVGYAISSGSTLHLYRDILGSPWAAGSCYIAGLFAVNIA